MTHAAPSSAALSKWQLTRCQAWRLYDCMPPAVLEGLRHGALLRRQLVVVFDADMVASPQFYTRVLAELADPQVTCSITGPCPSLASLLAACC